ncbi:unnamed protein product [Amoebophrya sp. A25]|nr:unnamed protein product [Amoebophrya sp. A25]|eukprot:GSA25T00014332001.1
MYLTNGRKTNEVFMRRTACRLTILQIVDEGGEAGSTQASKPYMILQYGQEGDDADADGRRPQQAENAL